MRRGSGLVDKHKVFFRQKKKSSIEQKLTANNEQCTATVLPTWATKRQLGYTKKCLAPQKAVLAPT